jgi:hypothetical protein
MAPKDLLTPEQHRRRAVFLRGLNPNSRAAELHELAARLKAKKALNAKGGSPMPRPSIPSLAELEVLLERARAELRAEQVLQLRPDVRAWRKDMATQHEMSLRAEIKLRRKALAHYRWLGAQ